MMCYGKRVTNSIYCLFVKSSASASKQPVSASVMVPSLCDSQPHLMSSKPQKLSPKIKDFLSAWERQVLPLLQD